MHSNSASTDAPLLQVRDLHTHFFTPGGTVKAVNGVSFDLQRGERLAIVGESGSGKSAMAMSLIQLLAYPGKLVSGSVRLDGRELVGMSERSLGKLRGAEIGTIFQDPMSSLDPVMPIRDQMLAPLRQHLGLSAAQAQQRAVELLASVGIPDPERRIRAYPFEMSGGMRQRIMIVMALACRPKLILADEPTTALDVTIQAQIVELLQQLTETTGAAMMFITHDLGLVARFAQNVAVMYAGRIVEYGPVEQIFAEPSHPYTQSLLMSIPSVSGSKRRRLLQIHGFPPDMKLPQTGCMYKERCPAVSERCRQHEPPLTARGTAGSALFRAVSLTAHIHGADSILPEQLQQPGHGKAGDGMGMPGGGTAPWEGGHQAACWLPDGLRTEGYGSIASMLSSDGAVVTASRIAEAGPTAGSLGAARNIAGASGDAYGDTAAASASPARTTLEGSFRQADAVLPPDPAFPPSAEPVLTIRDLHKHFGGGSMLPWKKSQPIRAVNGISFTLHRGETIGIVGESGCGKSTTARMLLQLDQPTGGTITQEGSIQMVFQDPSSSFNPKMKIRELIAEPLHVKKIGTRMEREARVRELIIKVGLEPSYLDRYPSQLSGGQRQRVGVARALALNPSVVVADEPTSALDVSVRAQIINLLCDLKDELGLSFVFISHDLSTVRYISDTIAVMYLGEIVEYGPAEAVFTRPAHPYTQALLAAVPVPDPAIERSRSIRVLGGELPSPANPPAGCAFSTRCPAATEQCRQVKPQLTGYREDWSVSCHAVS